MARKGRAPTIEARLHQCDDGSATEMWSVRYYGDDGTRRRRRCGSREEAEFQRARLVFEGVSTASSALVSPRAQTGSTRLMEFWPLWAADARGRLARSTMREYERLWARRLAPKFGAVFLDAIKPRDVSQWRSELLAASVGPEAVRYAMVLLQAIFTVAIEWGEASANPVSVVRKPRQGRRRAVQPIPPEGVEALRADFLARGDVRSATLVCVLAYAGLRPGEALGLELRHVREHTLLIEQAVSDGRLKVQKTGRAYRTVDLLAPLANDLNAWTSCNAAIGTCEALLFARRDAMPWRTDDWRNWRGRHFLPAANRVGLGRPRPYDRRHSFASLLIREQKSSVVDIAQQLGHAAGMTLSTYGHVFSEHRRTQPVDVTEWIVGARKTAGASRRHQKGSRLSAG